MTQRRRVKGANPAVIWLFIVLFLLLTVAVVFIIYVVAPTQQFARQADATATAQQAAAAITEQQAVVTATAQAAVVEQRYAAGLTFAQVGDWPAAADAFRQTIALDAGYKDAQTQLQQAIAQLEAVQATATAAIVALAAQRQGDAQATVAAATTATAQALAALYARGQGLMNLGRWAEAEATLQGVFDVDPTYQDVQTLLATVAAETSKLAPTATPLPTHTPTVTPTPTPNSTATAQAVATQHAAAPQIAQADPTTTTTATRTHAPTPTSIPQPTATPSAQISFNTNPTTIAQGACSTLTWSVENVQAVWVYSQDQPYQQYPQVSHGSQQICPR